MKNMQTAIPQLKAVKNVDRVLSIFTLDHISGTEDGFEVRPLFSQSDWALPRDVRQQVVLDDRIAPGFVVSEDGKALALVVRLEKNLATAQQIEVRTRLFQILKQQNLSSYLTAVSGPSEVVYMQYQAMIDSLNILMPLASFLSFALLIWLFPRVLAIALAGLSIGLSALSAIFVLNVAGQDFTMIHSMIPPMITALATALIIHYYNRIVHYSSLGLLARERSLQAAEDIFKPALYTVLTTAGGLASLSFSPLPTIQSFGLSSAFGVLFMFFVVLILMPPILMRWDRDRPWSKGRGPERFSAFLALSCGRFALRHAGKVLVVVFLMLAVASPFLSRVRVETDVFRFFDEKHRITVDTQTVEDQLSGTITLGVLFETPQVDAFQSPDFLLYLQAFQNWLEGLPEIDESTSMAEIIEDMNWAFHGENPDYRRIPDNQDLVVQYLFFYDGDDLFELTNRDFNAAQVTINLNVHETGEIRRVVEKIETYLREHPYPEVRSTVAGFGSLFARLADMIVKTQIYSLLSALVVIFIFLVFVFRSFGSALLCMVPNISPALITFILMGAFNIWLDIGTAMIASVSVGIAVDDTIHIYHGYISRRRKGCSPVFSLMRSYQHAGRSVVATSLVLGTQFFIIAFSDFAPTSHFGLLSGIGILTALFFDLLVLPALILVLNKYFVRASN
ncbi:MAG: MMPL family transporter [Alphaproteobacteria bacterium]|nr:MMPL family transporter [Alphaproteobacteria bacterium]